MEESRGEISEVDENDDSTSESELDSSRLGTKEYWEETFSRDLELYKETKDVGEIWFGNDSMKRVIDWMANSALLTTEHTVLDIGCGNGMMLVQLARNGYKHLFGVDYADSAIQLAQTVAETEGLAITYQVGNVLDDLHLDGSSCLGRQYDICHDKGTYDAISLNPSDAKLQRTKYINGVRRLCRPTGLLIVTSCNWTKAELVEHFSEGFLLLEQIPGPTFQFGGITGSRETVLVFRRS